MPYVRGVASSFPEDGDRSYSNHLIPEPPPVTFQRPRPVRRVPTPPSYIRDWENVSPEEILAVTRVAGAWRGFLTRRTYRTNNITATYQYNKAVKLQSFVRVANARTNRRTANKAREAWANHRVQQYVNHQLDKMMQLVAWQGAKYEDAALKVQRLFRWYMRIKQAREIRRTSIDPSRVLTRRLSDPEEGEEPMPTSTRKTSIYSYERRRSTKLGLSGSAAPSSTLLLSQSSGSATKSGNKFRRVSTIAALKVEEDDGPLPTAQQSTDLILVDSAAKKKEGLVHISPLRHVRPPGFAAVMQANTKMRSQLVEHQDDLLQQQDRIEAKQRGILQQDMPHCAAVLQRRFRIGMAASELHSRQCRAEYFCKYAVIVQRSIKCYFSRCLTARKRAELHKKADKINAKFVAAGVARVAEEWNWNRYAMDRAAIKIQTLWRAFAKYFLRNGERSLELSRSESMVADLKLDGSMKARSKPKREFRRHKGKNSREKQPTTTGGAKATVHEDPTPVALTPHKPTSPPPKQQTPPPTPPTAPPAPEPEEEFIDAPPPTAEGDPTLEIVEAPEPEGQQGENEPPVAVAPAPEEPAEEAAPPAKRDSLKGQEVQTVAAPAPEPEEEFIDAPPPTAEGDPTLEIVEAPEAASQEEGQSRPGEGGENEEFGKAPAE